LIQLQHVLINSASTRTYDIEWDAGLPSQLYTNFRFNTCISNEILINKIRFNGCISSDMLEYHPQVVKEGEKVRDPRTVRMI
jgi:hypothetical protein